MLNGCSRSQIKIPQLLCLTLVGEYSTTSRNMKRVNRNHHDIYLRVPHKTRNSLAWVLPTSYTSSVCPTSIQALHRVSADSRADERELCVIYNEKSWSLSASARRRVTPYCRAQVRMQGAGSEPFRASRAWTQFPCRN